MKLIDRLPRTHFVRCTEGARKPSAMRDYNSPEKALLKTTFNSLSYMDIWVCSIIEGYIYKKVDTAVIDGYREEYMLRYMRKEGECKRWNRGRKWVQSFYKGGKLEGEYKEWNEEGELIEDKIYENGEVVKDLLLTE